LLYLSQACGPRATGRYGLRSASMKPKYQLTLVALLGCAWCLLYPALAAPVVETTAPDQQPQYRRPSAATADAATFADLYAQQQQQQQQPPPPPPARALEPLTTHNYRCKDGSCNLCHFRPSEIHPKHQFDPLPGGDSAQARVEGTNVTAAELAEFGIRYLQVGGDWWNKCGDGWLNADFVYTRLPVGFVCEDWRTGRYILRQDAGHRAPFEDDTFEIVYSEHMFEHILPMDGSAFLREMYRILKPGGVLRVTTPDLEKYLVGYTQRKEGNTFLQEHAARFPPMGKLGPPYTAATIVNNIFRNYEHRWVYDFEEFQACAVHAGVPREAVVHSSRLGADLPQSFREAVRAAEVVATARRQAGMRENPTRCWLEQEVREPETLYVTITKPLRPPAAASG